MPDLNVSDIYMAEWFEVVPIHGPNGEWEYVVELWRAGEMTELRRGGSVVLFRVRMSAVILVQGVRPGLLVRP